MHMTHECPICERTVHRGQPLKAIAGIAWDPADPLHLFHRAVCHQECFDAHPDSAKVESRWRDLVERLGTSRHPCMVCRNEIVEEENLISLGYFSVDAKHPLTSHNYAQMHRQCLPAWKDLPEVSAHIERLCHEGGPRVDHWRDLLVETAIPARLDDLVSRYVLRRHRVISSPSVDPAAALAAEETLCRRWEKKITILRQDSLGRVTPLCWIEWWHSHGCDAERADGPTSEIAFCKAAVKAVLKLTSPPYVAA